MDEEIKKEKIIIFDTTLRDGEQSPGASLTQKAKIEIAHQLKALGVDIIEAGFPVSSRGDFEAVKMVAKEVKGPVICGLARSLKKDIDAANQALSPAKRRRIHVFLATSKIHMKYKLKKAEEEILRQAVWAVKYAKKKCPDVEFSPEDATRTDPLFLYRVIEAVIEAGATTVNIPDTVGYAMPEEFERLISGIVRSVPNIDKTILSVHCHNDLGLAVANSIAAIVKGARQVECTVNGIGERAGNASMEEIVMALATRADLFNIETSVRTKEIMKASRLVSTLTGIPVQPNKAIVGGNAFSHEAGIHQDGILKKRTTYEIMKPSDVGVGESHLVLGKHSGRHAFKDRLKKLGFHLKEKEIDSAFEEFKALADKKKEIFDEDLETIVEGQIAGLRKRCFKLEEVYVESGNKVVPKATIKLKIKGKIITRSSTGDGPVDACYKAIDKMVRLRGKLLDYQLRAVTRGKDALGEVSVKMKAKGKIVTGRGASTDIIEASALAYINALNRLAAK
ncbi:MAG: 2-isopropylmalate synthase [Candidatus Omnitrophica bacterium]|nr:2-isopropylmalate synthase [Candidatus Omnitrophota bacterium]